MTVTMRVKELVVCFTCGAVVHSAMEKAHERWHQDIADVAIENTHRIQELEAGYGDVQ